MTCTANSIRIDQTASQVVVVSEDVNATQRKSTKPPVRRKSCLGESFGEEISQTACPF